MHKMPLADHTVEDWDLEVAVNARAAFILCQALVPAMAVRGAGIVVNVASIWASRGGPERAAYIASKHALLGLTRALAAEYFSAGVRINAVSPGVAYIELWSLGGARISLQQEAIGTGTTTISVPMSNLAPGSYVVKVIVNNNTHVAQVVKM